MSTGDMAMAALEFALTAAAVAVAVSLFVQIRRGAASVRLLRWPVPRPRLLAAAYLCFAIGFGAQAVHDLVGYSPPLSTVSLLGMGGALVFIVIGATRRTA